MSQKGRFYKKHPKTRENNIDHLIPCPILYLLDLEDEKSDYNMSQKHMLTALQTFVPLEDQFLQDVWKDL